MSARPLAGIPPIGTARKCAVAAHGGGRRAEGTSEARGRVRAGRRPGEQETDAMSGTSLVVRVSRVSRVAALLVGLLVLVLSVITSVTTARRSEMDAQDDGLNTALNQQVDALESYFERSRTINLMLADNPVFTDFY